MTFHSDSVSTDTWEEEIRGRMGTRAQEPKRHGAYEPSWVRVGCGNKGKCQDLPEFTLGTWLSSPLAISGRGSADAVCFGSGLDGDAASALMFL